MKNFLLSTILIGSIFFTTTAYAYDLPQIFPDKKSSASAPVAVSDWSSFKNFEQKIKSLLAENNLPASSPARIYHDKNLIFIAFYKDYAYFLDRYSLKVERNTGKVKSWKQHIFPIGQGISPKNSKFIQQKFCLQDKIFYNSLRQRDKISAAPTVEDKIFLAECFRVGYYYAFKREIDTAGIFDKQ